MKEFVATITRKGQITIPSEIRRHLGVVAPDKIAVVLADDGTVELRPARYTVASLRGIVPALVGRETVDFDEQIAEAQEVAADRAIQEIAGL